MMINAQEIIFLFILKLDTKFQTESNKFCWEK
jgi:hypothetical protein